MNSNITRLNTSGAGLPNIRLYAAGLHGVLAVPIIFGNLLTLISWLKFKILRRRSNILVVNLALTDLMVGLVLIPYEICSYVVPHMEIAKVTCILRFTFFILFMLTSFTTLLAISVERYIAIAYPLHYSHYITGSRIVGSIVAMWCFNTALSVAPLIGWNNWERGVKCVINEIFTRNYRFACDVIVGVCLLLNVGFYTRVAFIVMRNSDLRHVSGELPVTYLPNGWRRTNIKHTKVMVLVLGLFIVCWLPILCLAAAEDVLDMSNPGLDIVRVVLLCIGMSNSGLNWIIYGWKNPCSERHSENF